MSKKAIVLCIIILAFFLLPVFSVTTVKASYTLATIAAGTQNADDGVWAVHPCDSANNKSAVGQVFTVTATGYLTNIKVTVADINKNATFRIEVMGYTGSYGTTAVPDDVVIDTSNDVYISATGDYIFDFGGDVELVSGTIYTFSIEAVEFQTGIQTHSSYHVTFSESNSHAYAGNSFGYANATWTAQASNNLFNWVVYGETDLPSTPAPLPTGGLNVDTSDTDAVMEALIGYGVPVVVMLLPTIFIWLIGGRGKWPMLIGISIGTGIGYLFGLVPIWLVFLISIGVVGFAYQSTRSGN